MYAIKTTINMINDFFSVADLIQKNANQFEVGRKIDDYKDWPFTLSIIVLFCYNTSTIEKYSEYKYWLISVKSKTMVPKSCPQSRRTKNNEVGIFPIKTLPIMDGILCKKMIYVIIPSCELQ